MREDISGAGFSVWGCSGDIFERYSELLSEARLLVDRIAGPTIDGKEVIRPEALLARKDEYLIVVSLESFGVIRKRAQTCGYRKERILCISELVDDLPSVVAIDSAKDLEEHAWIKVRNHGQIVVDSPVCIVTEHKRVTIDCEVGSTIRLDGCTLYDDARLYCGEGGVLTISEGTSLGVRSIINCRSSLYIGKNCMISWGVTIMDNDGLYVIDEGNGRTSSRKKETRVGDKCWIGCNTTILKGCFIGPRSVIGAGAVVVNDIPEGVMAGGVPAKVLKSDITWRVDYQ